MLDWKLQKCSLLDLVETFISQGILFSNDEIQILSKRKKTRPILKEMPLNTKSTKDINSTEDNLKMKLIELSDDQLSSVKSKILKEHRRIIFIIVKSSTSYNSDYSFISEDKAKLAIAIIVFLRFIAGIVNVWYSNYNNRRNSELSNLNKNMSFSEIKDIVDKLISTYSTTFHVSHQQLPSFSNLEGTIKLNFSMKKSKLIPSEDDQENVLENVFYEKDESTVDYVSKSLTFF